MTTEKEVDAYIMALGSNASELSKEVNAFLKKGWVLYGSSAVSISAYSSGIDKAYTQAMVRYKQQP